MNSRFETSRLKILPLGDRKHDLDLSVMMPLETVKPIRKDLVEVARRIALARARSSSVVLMMGAHTLRSGIQRYLIDLMEKGYVSCVAVNGAGVIHDFEFALIGQTTESVSRYIRNGQFGLWKEVGIINDIVNEGTEEKLGVGEAVGRAIDGGAYPHKEFSIFAAGFRLGIPVTVHVGIGYDIVFEHPNCDGAAWGASSYRDFLRLAEVLRKLQGGVVMNFGSAVMAPEVFLKALSMARNVAWQEGGQINRFTTLVCDLHDLPNDFRREPPKDSAAYFFRPWKTMLVRTVADGGESFYVKGRHAETIPELWSAINSGKDI